MKTKRLLFKSVYYFTGLYILISTGFNVYQYQQIKKLSEKPVPDASFMNEPASDTRSAPYKWIKNNLKNSASANKEKTVNTVDADELEYHLDAAEEELDMAYTKLSDEILKKDEFKKTLNEYENNLLTNPAFKKRNRDTLILSLDNKYNSLFKRLNISKEGLDELKSIMVDQMMETMNIEGESIPGSSDGYKSKTIQETVEIRENYENEIADLLGDENREIYQSYMDRLMDRISLNEFMETLSPDNRIEEEKTEDIINSMYEARKAADAEMIAGRNSGSSSGSTEETLAYMMGKSARINEKYLEACNDKLSPAQMERFKTYLNQRYNKDELMSKMNSYLSDN